MLNNMGLLTKEYSENLGLSGMCNPSGNRQEITGRGQQQNNYKIQSRIMQLGKQVLKKISDLLVQIDKPKAPKRSPSVQPDPGSHDPTNTNNRLYENYKKMRDRALQRQKQKIKQQMQTMQQFKVDNKHSIFLNTRNKLKPIHQRTTDIIVGKQLEVQRIRSEINLEKQRRQRQQQLRRELENQDHHQPTRIKSTRKPVTKGQLQEILNRLTQRERERNEKVNRQKMDYLKTKLMNNKDKPTLNKNTEKIWEKRKLNRLLSSNVFERFVRYTEDHEKRREEFINTIRLKQTPFKPNISKYSIEILNKSINAKSSTTKKLNRSVSCRCLTTKKSVKPHSEESNHKKSNSFHQHYDIEKSKHVRSEVQFTPYRCE